MIRVGRQLAKAGLTGCLPATVVGIGRNYYFEKGRKKGQFNLERVFRVRA
jgi:hypothetical protein